MSDILETLDPRDADKLSSDREEKENDSTILPSNGPGLAGDDGEQVVTGGGDDDEEEDDDDDDDEEDDIDDDEF